MRQRIIGLLLPENSDTNFGALCQSLYLLWINNTITMNIDPIIELTGSIEMNFFYKIFIVNLNPGLFEDIISLI